MQDCKPINTPMEKGETLSLRLCPITSKENEQVSKVLYLSAVGSLIYGVLGLIFVMLLGWLVNTNIIQVKNIGRQLK